jgi:acyl-homoserine-lactone acylase
MLYRVFVFNTLGLSLDNLSASTAVAEREGALGSNAWAVAPSKSATGEAMLFINPHVPFFGPTQFYEGHLRSAKGLNVAGAAFLGFPLPLVGHNDHLGWSYTVNSPDIADVYAEKFDDASNPLAYRYGGGRRVAVEWVEEIRVKTAGGLTTRQVKLRKTHHGPVVSARDGQSLTLKLAKLEEGGLIDQWHEMSRARSLAEFKAAMSRLAVPMFNTVYADSAGNIFYVYNGAVPRRSTKFDWSKPVDGSTPETEWQGYRSFGELPQLTNPKAGFLQNCNTTPFVTTTEGNPDRSRYPAYMTSEPDNPRAKTSRRILSAKDKFTFAEWARAAFDTTVGFAEVEIPPLVEEWEKLKQSDAARAARLEGAVVALKSWNQVSAVESTEMTLFTLWFHRLAALEAGGAVGEPWLRIRALEEVIGQLEGARGTWRVAWGEINRLQRIPPTGETSFSDERASLPVAGARA